MCATPAAVCGGLVNISSVFLFFSLDFTLISLSVSMLSDRGFHRDYSQEEGGFCPCLILTNSHTFHIVVLSLTPRSLHFLIFIH